MAIKVNGTTVIDDSRNLVNIASGAGASTTYGDVGTYVFGHRYASTQTENTTYAGSGINPAGVMDLGTTTADNTGQNADMQRGAGTLSGTWRAMGRSNGSAGITYSRITLFVRIS